MIQVWEKLRIVDAVVQKYSHEMHDKQSVWRYDSRLGCYTICAVTGDLESSVLTCLPLLWMILYLRTFIPSNLIGDLLTQYTDCKLRSVIRDFRIIDEIGALVRVCRSQDQVGKVVVNLLGLDELVIGA